MKRRDVIKRIREGAAAAGVDVTFTEGTRHTLIDCGGVRSTLGRHSEIADLMARIIFKQLESALGKDWWR